MVNYATTDKVFEAGTLEAALALYNTYLATIANTKTIRMLYPLKNGNRYAIVLSHDT